MRPMKPSEAAEMFCPFTFNGHRAADKCLVQRCMAWRETHARVEREDHSGARERMNEFAMKSMRHVRREGPAGSTGRLILDEQGVCARLSPDQPSS